MACHGLAEAEAWHAKDVWLMLAGKATEKQYDYEIVQSARWDPTTFKETGKEHCYESQISDFGKSLFFKGKYSGLGETCSRLVESV